MKLFDVYPLFDIEPVRAEGCYVWDKQGSRYLDLYGGHAVISIGHTHPHYVMRISEQLDRIGFYSNSVLNSLQQEFAAKLGELSGYDDYDLFLVNSGAEAVENALKVAAFHTKRKGAIMVDRAFHGRTSGAVAVTDNSKIQSAMNSVAHVVKIPFDDLDQLRTLLATESFGAVIIEGIQGVGGVFVPENDFLQNASTLCKEHGTILILDEIQSGYGRSGKFFAHQYAGIKPDLITIAKGMGNGFPIGGVLIGPQFEAWHGMLGTTFGGNHLACAAGLAVLEVIESEGLIAKAEAAGKYLIEQLLKIPQITEVRGRGLMIGISCNSPAKAIREALLTNHHIFTGSAADPHTLRLLPPLGLSRAQADAFLAALKNVLAQNEESGGKSQ